MKRKSYFFLGVIFIMLSIIITGCNIDEKAVKIFDSAEDVEALNEFELSIKLNDKWGVIDENGKIILQPKYNKVKNAAENGIYIAKSGDKESYVNKQGEKVIEGSYDFLSEINDGIAVAMNDWQSYIMDKSGNLLFSKGKGVSVSSFSEGMAGVRHRPDAVERLTGYIDKAGKFQLNLSDELGISRIIWLDNFVNGHTAMYYYEQLGSSKILVRVIDNKSNEIFTAKTDQRFFGVNQIGYITFKSKSGYGFYDYSTQKTVSLERWDDVGFFKHDYATVKKNDKWGIIDTKGNLCVDYTYSEEPTLGDGIFIVHEENNYNVIDITSKKVIMSGDKELKVAFSFFAVKNDEGKYTVYKYN